MMKRVYKSLEMTTFRLQTEGGFFSASVTPVEQIEITVEVDDYIKVDDMEITFD